MKRLWANSLLFLTALIWGITFAFQSLAMDWLSPYQFIAVRYLIGAVSVIPLVWWEVRRSSSSFWQLTQQHKRLRILAPLLGVWMFIAISLQQYSLLYTSVANAGFLTSLYLPFVPVLGFLFLKYSIRHSIWVAVGISLFGSWLLFEDSSLSARLGDILLIFSAFFWALHILTIQQIVQKIQIPFQLSFLQSMITCLLASMYMITIDSLPSWQSISQASTALLYSGAVSVGIGFSLQFVAQRYVPASNATLILASEAVFAALAGWWILNEGMSQQGLLGAACILLAIFLSEFFDFRRNRKKTII